MLSKRKSSEQVTTFEQRPSRSERPLDNTRAQFLPCAHRSRQPLFDEEPAKLGEDDAASNYETDGCEVQTAVCVRLFGWVDPFGDLVLVAKAGGKVLALGLTARLWESHKCQRYFSDCLVHDFKRGPAKPGLLGSLA